MSAPARRRHIRLVTRISVAVMLLLVAAAALAPGA
jgi:hypothetical protein